MRHAPLLAAVLGVIAVGFMMASGLHILAEEGHRVIGSFARWHVQDDTSYPVRWQGVLAALTAIALIVPGRRLPFAEAWPWIGVYAILAAAFATRIHQDVAGDRAGPMVLFVTVMVLVGVGVAVGSASPVTMGLAVTTTALVGAAAVLDTVGDWSVGTVAEPFLSIAEGGTNLVLLSLAVVIAAERA